MYSVDFTKVNITGGFWKEKQDLNRNTTIKAVYDRFLETGRFEDLKCEPNDKMEKNPKSYGVYFLLSDVAKWSESVAYLTQTKREPEFEAIVDNVVDLIEKNQLENGYFHPHFIRVEPEAIYTRRFAHELYCTGHLIEAAIAYHKATGKRKFLDLMIKCVDYIEKRFYIDRDTDFATPGHEEIEIALIKLYEHTGVEKYLNLAKFFLETRGTDEDKPNSRSRTDQSHLPIREQKTAEGHAVRATYLYSAMSDLAYHTKDETLVKACDTIFDNISQKKMYITGGIGSSSHREAFTVDYDLPNMLAYSESCAAIGLIFFAQRMLKLDTNSKYSDTIERILYNGFLSSISLDGKAFFYENPLEVLPYFHKRDVCTSTPPALHLPAMERSEVFGCSCCPPNITRLIATVSNLAYTTSDDTLFVHQFMESDAEIQIGGKTYSVKQKTNYPMDGKITIKIKGGDLKIAVRIPWWVSGHGYKTEKGYAYFEVKDGECVEFDFDMTPKFIEARVESYFDCGKYAIMRGPVVYCMEEHDNGKYIRDIRIAEDTDFKLGTHSELKVPTLTVKAYRRPIIENAPLYCDKKNNFEKVEATLIPYHAFANRGACEMQVWLFIK